MSYNEVIQYLFESLPMFQRVGAVAYKANLDNTHALMQHLGHPEHKFKSIHIAGTNGKGSNSHLIAAVLQSAGYKTGLYTSPHLKDFRERIRLDGTMIPEGYVCDFIEKNRKFFDEIKPSFFEMTVALAFDYFASEGVDIAVVEVGMGGRLDSTNVINPLVSVITNIGLDHTQFLGNTLAEIAGEKAGIIKPDTPVVVGETDEETAPVFIKKSHENNAEIHFADQELSLNIIEHTNSALVCDVNVVNLCDCEGVLSSGYKIDDLQFSRMRESFSNLKVGLSGIYQKKNILTALATLDIAKSYIDIPTDAIYKGFADVVALTGLQGRWQVLQEKPLVICDTGHNTHGLKQVLEHIKNIKYNKLHFVFGVVSDKDIEGILNMLPKDAEYYFCKADMPRGLDAESLRIKAQIYGLLGKAYPSVAEALATAKQQASDNDFIFVGGSTFIVAEVV